MAFNRDEVADLLKACHRRCCICHRFCGVKMETDHIVPKDDEGTDDIDNAIPVCFECHAEIHCYNVKHPRGRRFTPEELRGHKAQWLDICANKPEVFTAASRNVDVGPLQALLDELEHNLTASQTPVQQRGWLFKDEQFPRAVREGVIAMLDDDLKTAISQANVAISLANERVHAEVNQDCNDRSLGFRTKDAIAALAAAPAKIAAARDKLLEFLGTDGDED
jgi:hypothetical protein